MRQSRLRHLLGGIVPIATTVLLLWISGVSSPVAAQLAADQTPTPSPSSAATPQPRAMLDSDSYETMISHFDKVSSRVLDIAKWVVIIVGTLGGASGVYTVWEARKIQGLRDATDELEAKIEKLKSELEESRQLTMDATDRLNYILELRDRNSEVRLRAAQKIAASNDIAAVSILVGLLENDQSVDVRLEAAYGLGRLISEGGEPRTVEQGIQALLHGTRDSGEEVRVEAVMALDTLICSDLELPRSVHRRLQELVRHDTIKDVVRAAREALEHLKQQREGKFNSSVASSE